MLLWKSADLLVTGGVGLAERLGISPLVIGLTVIAMGTSAPELASSIAASARGAGDIALGNVYGSNIANLALVGGLIAIISPLSIQKRSARIEIPVMVAVGVLLWPILKDFSLSRLEGILLLIIFTGLISLTIYFARQESKKRSSAIKEAVETSVYSSEEPKVVSLGYGLLYTFLGLCGVALGAELALRGATAIGGWIGLSEAVIGLTIVAVGTSLPELATCLVAALKKHSDISVGNLVGSNIFNTLLVTGAAGTVCPFSIGGRLIGVDYMIMIAVSVVFGSLAILSRQRMGKKSGVLLFAGYILYMIYIFVFTANK